LRAIVFAHKQNPRLLWIKDKRVKKNIRCGVVRAEFIALI